MKQALTIRAERGPFLEELTRDIHFNYIMHRLEWGRHSNPETGIFTRWGLDTKTMLEKVLKYGDPYLTTYTAGLGEGPEGPQSNLSRAKNQGKLDFKEVARLLQKVPCYQRIEATEWKLTKLSLVILPEHLAEQTPVWGVPPKLAKEGASHKRLHELTKDLNFCYIANRIRWGHPKEEEQGKQSVENLFKYFVDYHPRLNKITVLDATKKNRALGSMTFKDAAHMLQAAPFDAGVTLTEGKNGLILKVMGLPQAARLKLKTPKQKKENIQSDPDFSFITSRLSSQTAVNKLVEYYAENPSKSVRIIDGIKKKPRDMGRMSFKRAANFLKSVSEKRKVKVIKDKQGHVSVALEDAAGGKIVMKTPKTPIVKKIFEEGFGGTRGRATKKKRKK